MIDVRFACGHVSQIAPTIDTAPICAQCGESRVQAVKARAPRFVGVATGPYAEHKALDAVPVNLAPKGALVLKEPSDG